MKTALVFLVSLSFLFQSVVARQLTFSGKVVDENSHSLAYVSIGIPGKPIGTVSDENGYFKLTMDRQLISETDSLRFSMIGYHSRSFVLIHFPAIDTEVQLQQKTEELKEVIVTANKTERKTIGTKHKSIMNMFVNFCISGSPDQNLGSEIGRRFSTGRKNAQIESFSFFISHNDFEKVKFRLNVYSIRKGKPGKSLLHDNIYMEVENKRTGWISIDLLPYNVIVNEDVIVSVEWVSKSGSGNHLSLPITLPATRVHFYKFGSQNHWKRYDSMTTFMRLTVLY